MKAAICTEFGKPFTIANVTLAEPRHGEIQVKLSACAICHSDIAYANGIWGGQLPAIYGHEAAGTVTALGQGVTNFTKDDRVLVTLIRACGHCPSCHSGQPTSCDHTWDATPTPLSNAQGNITRGMNVGGFAESCVVDASQCVKLPDDIALDVASLLACGVITGIGAVVNTAKMKPGSNVAVIGAGGVGLNTIQGAAICGAAKIIALDINTEKLEAAREFGATDTILSTTPNVPDQIRALTNGRGVDYAFVTVGVPAVFQNAPDLLAAGGAMVMVGMTGNTDEVTYKPVNISSMNQSLLGSRMGQTVLERDIPWLIDLYRQGRLKLDELVTNRWRLDQINEAMADTRGGKARRNVIVFD
jgi:S-(hydroxymethyl)glutathione dehydrogenase/alcohol dehydrogenase